MKDFIELLNFNFGTFWKFSNKILYILKFNNHLALALHKNSLLCESQILFIIALEHKFLTINLFRHVFECWIYYQSLLN